MHRKTHLLQYFSFPLAEPTSSHFDVQIEFPDATLHNGTEPRVDAAFIFESSREEGPDTGNVSVEITVLALVSREGGRRTYYSAST